MAYAYQKGFFNLTYIVWFLAIATLLASVGYPLFMLIYSSFVHEGHFSLRVYQQIMSEPETLEYTINTLVLGLIVTFFATIIGVLMAWVITRTDLPYKGIIRTIAVLPFIFPPYIGAIAWIQLAAPYIGYLNRLAMALGLPGNTFNIYTFWGLVMVMSFRFYVYTFLTTSAALEQMDPSLEEAARMSGARMLKVAKDVTLRLVAPSIASGALLTFVAVISNFGIPALIGSRAKYHVLTTKIYAAFSIPDIDRATAYSIILLILAGIGLYLQRRLFRERKYTTITGKTVRPSVAHLGKWKIPVLVIVLVFVTITAIIPLVSIIISAFLKEIRLNPLDPNSWTIENLYEVLFVNPDTTTAIRTSLFLATSAATIITLYGALLAYIIVKTTIKGRMFLDWLSSVPYALPGTVVAIAIILAFIKTPIFNTIWILLLAYFVRYLSYGVRTVVGSLMQIDPSLEEAARMCGANWLRTMKDIVMPLLKHGLIAAWILVFMPTLGELTVSIILYPPNNPTIGVATYNLMEEGQYNWAFALAFIVAMVIMFANFLINKITGRLGVRGL